MLSFSYFFKVANGIGYEQCATLELGFEIFYTLSPGTMLDIAVRLQHSGWIGFGFSNNDRMLEVCITS